SLSEQTTAEAAVYARCPIFTFSERRSMHLLGGQKFARAPPSLPLPVKLLSVPLSARGCTESLSASGTSSACLPRFNFFPPLKQSCSVLDFSADLKLISRCSTVLGRLAADVSHVIARYFVQALYVSSPCAVGVADEKRLVVAERKEWTVQKLVILPPVWSSVVTRWNRA
ncbi:hypothetical protein BaRGS_00004569, partial [Batillaria attramentaria]